MLDSGCCGMAGSFGFEAGHYDVSVAVGERVLLPAVRQAADDTLIIADGFSCREQIAGLTGRGALHLAQVIQMALHEGPEGPAEALPEMSYQPLGKWEPQPGAALTALAIGSGVLAGAALVWALGRHRRAGISSNFPPRRHLWQQNRRNPPNPAASRPKRSFV